MFNINEVGPKIRGNNVEFRIYLPNITPDRFKVRVYLISKEDQFNKNVPSSSFELNQVATPDAKWGDLNKDQWISQPIPLDPQKTYLYRFEITGPSKHNSAKTVSSLYFGDPFAKDTADGIFSVVKIEQPQTFTDNPTFKIPNLKDAIIYEIDVAEFNQNFEGIVTRIPYLKSLGINVIELMPITSVDEPSQWGYMPVFYFAPEERYGGSDGLRKLVKACHDNGIAIILDVVYAHTANVFPYQIAYEPFFDLWEDNEYKDSNGIHRSPNPLVSSYSNFGHKNDFRMKSTQEFFAAVNRFWIEEYHIDGFRYDHVNGYLDRKPIKDGNNIDWYSPQNRPTFKSLQDLTNQTYEFSKSFSRFQNSDGSSRIIQIAEDLGESAYQLSPIANNAINGCWEKTLHNVVKNLILYRNFDGQLPNELLAQDARWQTQGYTGKKIIGSDQIDALPIQYIESHDESRLMYLIGKHQEWDETGYEFDHGLQNQAWWKLQPYAIALLTSFGIPMLWAGQEFAENYGIPSGSQARVRGERPLHWDYFYKPQPEQNQPIVLPLVTLYRRLCQIRSEHSALKGNINQSKLEILDPHKQVIVYRRWDEAETMIVILNFSDSEQEISVPFGTTGEWSDLLGETNEVFTKVLVSDPQLSVKIKVNSNLGRIYRFS